MSRAALVLALACAACGGDDDPCDGITGACITLHVDSTSVDRIDQLELDVLYGATHGTATTMKPGGGAFGLPVTTSLTLDALAAPTHLGVVAAGKLAGAVEGTGAAVTMVAPDEHVTLSITLGPPKTCVAGGHYCGGDKLAGDPDTVYTCNGGGVPLARGACPAGCHINPNGDDYCNASGGPCTENAAYCGGDELEGDPQSLYRCSAGVGTQPMVCANGCLVRPGQNDICR